MGDLVADGIDRDAVVIQAVEEFGDASALASNLIKISNNRKRWMMRFATLCTIALFLLGVFAMAMWPDDAQFGTPNKSVAQTDAPDQPAVAVTNQPAVAANLGAADVFERQPVATRTQPSKSTVANDAIRKKLQ